MILAFSFAYALDAKKLPGQDIFLDDGQSKKYTDTVEFAVVGNVRPAKPGEAEASKRVAAKGVTDALVRDISATVQEGRTEFVVLLGNLVPTSSIATWKAFTRQWVSLISGTEPPEGPMRTRVLPVAGEDDGAGDDRYTGLGGAFPGLGADIGFNRVATWYHVDLEVGGHTWRLLTVDSNKTTLGSRWEEQLAFVEKVVKDDDAYDSLLVFTYHPLITLAVGQKANVGEGTSELLDLVEAESPVGALKAVFSGGSTANEVYLPRGKFGELYVVAGGGGAPADTIERWGHAEAGGFPDVKLETTYDFALLREFERQAELRKCSTVAMDHAKSVESWKGFPGAYEASCMPTQGWWDVALTGERMELNYRQVQPDLSFKAIYTATFSGKKNGWTIGK